MEEQLATLPHILSYRDAILTPIYFLLIIIGLYVWKEKKYRNSPLKKYIIPAFILKAICCILVAFIYEFYYNFHTDCFDYYTSVVEIWHATKANPLYGLELVFLPLDKCSPAALSYTYHMTYGFVAPVVSMYKFSGFVGMFCFGTYLPIALILTLLGYIGTWKIFLVFYEEFPKHYKKIAGACLFAPSILEWCNNIMKDPICIFGLGLCISGLYNFIRNRFRVVDLFKILAGAFLLLSLKSYLFYLFCIAAAISIYHNYLSKIKNRFYKRIIKTSLFLLSLCIIILLVLNSEIIQEKAISGFKQNFEIVQEAQIYIGGGSTYVLPNTNDFSFIGILSSYFLSLNVALFRPYLWEVPNVFALINTFESTVTLVVTIYLLAKTKIVGFFRFATTNPLLSYSLVFTLLLAPVAGFISFNFGTLSRYKMPVLPFYYSYLVLLYYQTKEKKLANLNRSGRGMK